MNDDSKIISLLEELVCGVKEIKTLLKKDRTDAVNRDICLTCNDLVLLDGNRTCSVYLDCDPYKVEKELDEIRCFRVEFTNRKT